MNSNYRIIGADGRHYGPVSGDQIRQWIREGRVDSRTAVLADNAKDWTFAGLLPEFASQFGATPPPTIAPPPVARRTSGFATAGLIFGVLSLFCCCCYGFPCNVLGLVFSSLALSQINRHPETYEGRGLAVAGLVLSLASILLYALVLVWALATGNFHVAWNNGY